MTTIISSASSFQLFEESRILSRPIALGDFGIMRPQNTLSSLAVHVGLTISRVEDGGGEAGRMNEKGVCG